MLIQVAVFGMKLLQREEIRNQLQPHKCVTCALLKLMFLPTQLTFDHFDHFQPEDAAVHKKGNQKSQTLRKTQGTDYLGFYFSHRFTLQQLKKTEVCVEAKIAFCSPYCHPMFNKLSQIFAQGFTALCSALKHQQSQTLFSGLHQHSWHQWFA